MAQRIYSTSPVVDEVDTNELKVDALNKHFDAYYQKLNDQMVVIPDLTGMSGMDAVALLENKGYLVAVKGVEK